MMFHKNKTHFLANLLLIIGIGLSSLLLSCQGKQEKEVLDFNGRDGQYTHTVFKSKARGWVDFYVYLPPGWSHEGSETYPLLIFLHGLDKSEHTMPEAVSPDQLNDWVRSRQVPPLVIVAPRGSDNLARIQWYTPSNEIMLISEEPGELRAYCRQKFRAGMANQTTSIQGFSRGASGTLHFALNYPDKFASAVANAFVSDYVLAERMAAAEKNREKIIKSGILLRIMIGTEDDYVHRYNRRGSPLLHEHLEKLKIQHDYEVLQGLAHSFYELWNSTRPDGMITGLYELRLHSRAWKNNKKAR